MSAPKQPTDKELLSLCQAGSELAYGQLYHRFARKIFNSIIRIVTDRAESEDILQETFITFFGSPDTWHRISNVEAWLRRIAMNKAISAVRKRRTYFVPVDDLEICDESDAEQIDRIWKECRLADLEAAINSLADIPKMIVNLYLFEEMSHEDVGRALGMSSVAVRSQYHRAKKKIYEQLKGGYHYAG